MVTTPSNKSHAQDSVIEPVPPTAGGNLGALSEWLAGQSGLNPALVQLARTLAGDLDAKPSAAVAREYRMVLVELVGMVVGAADGQATLLELVRTPLANPKNTRKKVVRSADRGGGGKSRVAVDAVATPSRRGGRGATA